MIESVIIAIALIWSLPILWIWWTDFRREEWYGKEVLEYWGFSWEDLILAPLRVFQIPSESEALFGPSPNRKTVFRKLKRLAETYDFAVKEAYPFDGEADSARLARYGFVRACKLANKNGFKLPESPFHFLSEFAVFAD